jgi:flavin-binding protein dodecin
VSQHTYRVIEVVGSSPKSSDEAISNAISDAAKTLRNIGWFQVVETRGHVQAGKIAHFQVTLKIGFTLEDRGSPSGS